MVCASKIWRPSMTLWPRAWAAVIRGVAALAPVDQIHHQRTGIETLQINRQFFSLSAYWSRVHQDRKAAKREFSQRNKPQTEQMSGPPPSIKASVYQGHFGSHLDQSRCRDTARASTTNHRDPGSRQIHVSEDRLVENALRIRGVRRPVSVGLH